MEGDEPGLQRVSDALMTAYLNEKFAPELLPAQEALVERIKQLTEEQARASRRPSALRRRAACDRVVAHTGRVCCGPRRAGDAAEVSL